MFTPRDRYLATRYLTSWISRNRTPALSASVDAATRPSAGGGLESALTQNTIALNFEFSSWTLSGPSIAHPGHSSAVSSVVDPFSRWTWGTSLISDATGDAAPCRGDPAWPPTARATTWGRAYRTSASPRESIVLWRAVPAGHGVRRSNSTNRKGAETQSCRIAPSSASSCLKRK
jgi:hypothetical protein